MKKYFLILATVIISTLSLAGNAYAATSALTLNHAYPKASGQYDVVVKEKAGDKLALYVNDKNPVYATANKQGWVTFHKAKLSGSGKLSFTHVYGNSKNQKPINYVRFFQLNGSAVSFLSQDPNKASTKQAPAPQSAPQATTTTAIPAPTPVQPTCSNGTYVNSAGNTVCSPEAAPSAPAGATAQCIDGTYSFSQSRSGTCSHHGGVGAWL